MVPLDTVPLAAAHTPLADVHTLCPDSAKMIPLTSSLPAFVEVPDPPSKMLPAIERTCVGLDVPIPTLPFESMKNAVVEANVDVVVPTQKSGCDPPAIPETASLA